MVEVGWQPITEPNMAWSDETDMFTEATSCKA